jgi:DNA-binding CsgD family transcriptional regulator
MTWRDRLVPEAEIGRFVRTSGRAMPSARETDVLRCLSHGMNARHAADALGITWETAREHTKNVRYVLKAKTATHAVAIALRRGLIT